MKQKQVCFAALSAISRGTRPGTTTASTTVPGIWLHFELLPSKLWATVLIRFIHSIPDNNTNEEIEAEKTFHIFIRVQHIYLDVQHFLSVIT
jgi:hypothetical protein